MAGEISDAIIRVRDITVCREHHDRGLRVFGGKIEPFEKLETVAVGKPHIEQDRVERALLGQAARAVALAHGDVGDAGTLQILRPVPPVSWIPLAIIWFGIANKPAIFLVFVGSFFPVLLSTIHGVKTCDRNLLRAGAMAGGKPGWLVLYDAPGADRKDGEYGVFGDLLRHA